MRLQRLVDTATLVSERGGRLAKVAALCDLLTATPSDRVSTVVSLLSGVLPHGRIGVGWSTLSSSLPELAATETTLTIADVVACFDAISQISGKGSKQQKIDRLSALFASATRSERDFLARLLMGELRQGAQIGLMTEAVAAAAEVEAAPVRRAAMVSGDLSRVAAAALTEGLTGLERFRIEIFRPLQPMLAQPAATLDSALETLGDRHDIQLEIKIDGARVQVHRQGEEIRVYSRRLNDVTASVPEVGELAATLEAHQFILDGETFAVRPDGRPDTFQTTMRRFGRRLDVEVSRTKVPLRVQFFDCLLLDSNELLDQPLAARRSALEHLVPAAALIPSCSSPTPAQAAEFLQAALRDGHEGLMAKSRSSTYQAGARGQEWLKIKPSHTLDLVVLAAEWGHGRRTGKLSNLHLGARDPSSGDFLMLGKTFKGMTDEMLVWQTRRLLDLEVGREGGIVWVRPELVVEVAFNDVQTSSQYDSGMALRFARVRRYRQDKSPEQVETIGAIRQILEGS